MNSLAIQHNLDLSDLNTFGLKSSAAHFIELTERTQLPQIADYLQQHKLPHLIIGEGSNLLLLEDFNGLVILNRLKGKLQTTTNQQSLLNVAAGENWHELVLWCAEQGLHGLENLALIPGTVGASPVQNIGAYGVEMADCCESVEYFDLNDQQFYRLNREDCQFAYRDSIFKRSLKGQVLITEVSFKLSADWQPQLKYAPLNQLEPTVTARALIEAVIQVRQQKLPDPRLIGNAGSFFKNPCVPETQLQALLVNHSNLPHYPQADGSYKLAAGWLIDQQHLKGFAVGGAAVHLQQALVLINQGSAKADDVLALCRHIRTSVYQAYGIILEPEVRFIGALAEVDSNQTLGAPVAG